MSLRFLIFLLKISSEGVRSHDNIFHKPIQYWDCTFSNYSCIVRYHLLALHRKCSMAYFVTHFICSADQSFTSAGTFDVRNPIDSLLADEGSAGLRFHGTLEGGVKRKHL